MDALKNNRELKTIQKNVNKRKRNPGSALIGLQTTAPCRTSVTLACDRYTGCYCTSKTSLRSRHLEVVGTRKKRAREKETREVRGSACTEGPRKSLPRRVPPSRAPVFSFARYFQAPATQATVKQKALFTRPMHCGASVSSNYKHLTRAIRYYFKTFSQ